MFVFLLCSIMASPRTRKVLKEVRVQDENNVSLCPPTPHPKAWSGSVSSGKLYSEPVVLGPSCSGWWLAWLWTCMACAGWWLGWPALRVVPFLALITAGCQGWGLLHISQVTRSKDRSASSSRVNILLHGGSFPSRLALTHTPGHPGQPSAFAP